MAGKETFLVIGAVDVGGIARSAESAGYTVYTVDYYGDIDTRRCSRHSLAIKDLNNSGKSRSISNSLLTLAKHILKENLIDSVLLASGIEDDNDLLLELHDLAPIIGNPPEVIKRVRDKDRFFKELKRINLPFPETHQINDMKEAVSASRDIGFPLVIKPSTGYGGIEVVKIEKKNELKKVFKRGTEGRWLIQEYVPGVPASLSILSDGRSSNILSLNEQLLGIKEFGQEKEFVYCGNIVPFDATNNMLLDCNELANEITGAFGLIGTNGIDVVISEDGKLNVIEINPRFQGTIECVERYRGINLVEEHVKTSRLKKLPKLSSKIQSNYHIRAILYAKSNYIMPDLTSYSFVRDVPKPWQNLKKGDPICSIIIDSPDRLGCINKVNSLSNLIYGGSIGG